MASGAQERREWRRQPTAELVVDFLGQYIGSMRLSAIRAVESSSYRAELLVYYLSAILELDERLRENVFDEVDLARRSRTRAQLIAEQIDPHRDNERRIDPSLYAPARALVERQQPSEDPLVHLGVLMLKGLGPSRPGESRVAFDAIVALQQADMTIVEQQLTERA